MAETAYVTNIQRYCSDDGPGIRTTVFLKGCPLRCVWCHNPETHNYTPECMQRTDKCTVCGRCIAVCAAGAREISVDENGPSLVFHRERCVTCGKCAEVCPNNACEVCGKEMTPDEAFATVARDKIFYKTSGGGMTVSGGECSARPSFTLELLRLAAESGFGRAIETCGHGPAEFFEKAADLGTLFLYDLKEMIPEKHKALTGVDNVKILANLEMLFARGADIIIRLPMIPGFNDADEDLDMLGAYLAGHAGHYQAVQMLPYHALGTGKARALGRTPTEPDPELTANSCAACRDRWLDALRKHGVEAVIL